MKKVGLITYHASHNCGSILQAYALQKVIREKIGLDNEFINFSNEGQLEMYSILKKVKAPRNIIGNLLKLSFYPLLKRQQRDFNEFIKQHLPVASEAFNYTEQLKAIDGKYEYYVCGSDQVWNTKAADFDDAYFLSFVTKGKKIAYATSLGATNIIEKDADRAHYKKLVSDFSSLSVREGNAQKLIQQIYDHPVDITLDPTLLLEKKDWEDSFDLSKPLIKGKYIFYYAFNYNDQVNEFVEEISKKHNLPVYIIDAGPWGPGRKFKYGFKLSKRFGPFAMMNLMMHADLVFTTSFHGTVFGTLFEKKFWFVKSNMHNKNDNRATFLLNQLGLINRFLDTEELKKVDLYQDITFDDSVERLKSLRKDSMGFLTKALS